MRFSNASMTPTTRAIAPVIVFAASLILTYAVVITGRYLGVVPDPATQTAQQTVGEFIIRLFLAFCIALSFIAIFCNKPTRRWMLEQRWPLVMVVLFAVGSAFSLADPFHPIRGEGNWIRYWTAGCLLIAGVLALASSMRRVYPILDRFVGFLFGALMVVASADEIFEFHERGAESVASFLRLSSSEEANDIPTLVIAVLGVAMLCAVLAFRSYGGRLGELLREERYRTPLRLFTFAVVTFAAAMALDSFDGALEGGVKFLRDQIAGGPDGAHDRLWLALTDVRALANSMEELLEYLAALGFLMMVGNLFSIRVLGVR